MRHKLIVALCAVTVAVVSAISVQAYNHYRTERNDAAAQAAAKYKQAALLEAKAQAQFKAQVSTLEALCQKDLTVYNALPAVQKAKTAAPDCKLQFVQ